MWYNQYKKDKKSIGAILAKMEEDGVPLRILESVTVGYGVVNDNTKVYATFTFDENDEPIITYANFTPIKREE